jgi:hypothetical protein
MPTYNKGVLDSGVATGWLYQSRGVSIECEKAEALDADGNVCAVKYFDHRAQVELEIVAPDGVAIPVPGSTVNFDGVTLPTVSAAGAITGTFSIGSGTDVKFSVSGTPKITEANNDYRKANVTCTRHLVNGLPAA